MSGKGWWNNALSGLESRLDTILAEGDQTKPQPQAVRPAKAQADFKLSVEPQDLTSSSDTQNRLVADVDKYASRDEVKNSSNLNSPPQKSDPSSSTVVDEARSSTIIKIADTTIEAPSVVIDSDVNTDELPVESLKNIHDDLFSLQTSHEKNIISSRDEVDVHLERIDALQSKLSYLCQQLASAAKHTSSKSEATQVEKILAEKDLQIATLMEEGQKLSKTEMKNLTIIKQLRSKTKEQNVVIQGFKQRILSAEESTARQTEKIRHAEAAEKFLRDRLKAASRAEDELRIVKTRNEEAEANLSELRKQLENVELETNDAEKRLQSDELASEQLLNASLKDNLEKLRTEKISIEDRAEVKINALEENVKAQREKARNMERELRSEITKLESKLELLKRSMEEATSSTISNAQSVLLRQVETLQTQYSLASDNWQGIETQLTSRIIALEEEQNEAMKRETDLRRKAREAISKTIRLQDELKSINEQTKMIQQEVGEQRSSAESLRVKLTASETAVLKARAELEREKLTCEARIQTFLEDKSNDWRLIHRSHFTTNRSELHRSRSLSAIQRKPLPDLLSTSILPPASMMPVPSVMNCALDDITRRPSSSWSDSRPKIRTCKPDMFPQSGSTAPDWVLHDDANPSRVVPFQGMKHNEVLDKWSPSLFTSHDISSVSTVGAGPSVQLMKRMSGAVRRLESEKAAHKEETQSLVAQRDDARREIVSLMQEIDSKRHQNQLEEELKQELQDTNRKYEMTLEMLGEKTEKVEELESDVKDLKRIYQELVQMIR